MSEKENEKDNTSSQVTKAEECAKIYDYLMKKFYYNLKTYPDTVNEYILKRREPKLKEDLYSVIQVCWDMLMAVANKDAHVAPSAYVEDDICSICVNMFRPFFTAEHWITATHHQNRQTAAMIRQQSDLFETHDGLYCSTIKYLDEFVADSCA